MPLEYISDGSLWQGERINGKTYPRGIEASHSDDALAAIGLRRVIDSDPAPTLQQLYAAAAQHRYAILEGGTVIDLGSGPMPMPTDTYMRSLIKPLRDDAVADAAFTVTNYRVGPNTYITATADQIIAIFDAVRAHVQWCFNANAAVDAKIADGTYTTLSDVVNASEWPA